MLPTIIFFIALTLSVLTINLNILLFISMYDYDLREFKIEILKFFFALFATTIFWAYLFHLLH